MMLAQSTALQSKSISLSLPPDLPWDLQTHHVMDDDLPPIAPKCCHISTSTQATPLSESVIEHLSLIDLRPKTHLSTLLDPPELCNGFFCMHGCEDVI